jgi:hypothetical protein
MIFPLGKKIETQVMHVDQDRRRICAFPAERELT